ncbi:MAG: 16S rRNA (guanine(966)-N(2))-methyltransferase [uncultured Sphingomonas sp.]|uniref:16S rRNA (Guanine(966)-N(2))-methyltransferase n=1 Tax=uncultured Sphingomonas sp. TaxID=158754 RepID=A0A6J4SZV5_9SPHN|nr:16S rRNA (guanine(966)-N(2))-methyltransferase RsmD [uncultured Sphingomonas sp.]CAA9509411.1 MAG: 16S rRNA (guanine(966)-N(2))-methyltransferase [uncultured Sphingomonas sp.]
MRVIAGRWRGRPLVAPPGSATRPTADRTRETLFNMLGSRLGSFEGLQVADLYAGSGALGFEALSRGAAHVTFVETDPAARAAIAANARTLETKVAVAAHSAQQLPHGAAFDLVLADPPYAAGSGSAVVGAVEAAGWLAPGGWLAVETARGDRVDSGGLDLEAERDSGRARVTLLRRPG